MADFHIYTHEERPQLASRLTLLRDLWPVYIEQGSIDDHYDEYREKGVLAPFQIYICDSEDRVIASASAMPVTWDAPFSTLPTTGWDWAMTHGIEGLQYRRKPTVLCARSITVARVYRGQGLSQTAINALREVARDHNLSGLIAPVRPAQKDRYPLTNMHDYIRWKRDDGAPFDYWLRAHWHIGGQLLHIASQSMTIRASVMQWERWTGLRLPQSGQYVIPGGIVPLDVDMNADIARYIEPNVWVHHTVTSA